MPKCRSYIRRRSIIAHAGGQSYTPPQIAKVYGFPTNVDGSGQTIGIIELGGGFVQSDLDAYFKSLGLAVKPVIAVSVDGAKNSPGDPNGADGEVMLDLCVIGAIAPGVQMRCYFAPNTTKGFADAIAQAVSDGCSAISISWGGPEDQWTTNDIMQMQKAFVAAKNAGVTVTAAAGDNGSSDGESGKHADYPASDPNVLGCGGTTLLANNGTRSSEVVWNDGSQGGATGGGLSSLFAMPSYQSGIGVVGNQMRAVPDVAGNADPNTGWKIIIDGSAQVIGGTSAVAPMWAALVALLNQSLGKRVGFINPLLYAVKAGFFDVTSGNNGVFVAQAGYDCCTGLGVPIGTALVAALSGSTPTPVPVPVPVPTPIPAPVPVPTPVPPVNIQKIIDGVFVKLMAQYINRPAIYQMLATVKALVDGYLATHPMTMETASLDAKPIIDMIFASIEAKYPQWASVLAVVNTLIDNYLAQQANLPNPSTIKTADMEPYQRGMIDAARIVRDCRA